MVRKFISSLLKKKTIPLAEKDGPKEVIVHSDPVGSFGTSIYSGYIQEEYLESLDGSTKAEIYDKMRRGDANVKMLLSAIKNPIKSANWEIEPCDDTDEARKDADLIKHILFEDMQTPFKKVLSEALTMVDFGFSLFEVTHKIVMSHPEFGPYIGLRSLSWRSPKTIERWNIDRKTEELVSVTQMAYGDLDRHVDIPAEFLLLFNLDQEGANFEGISLLRACYGNWLRKNTY